MSQLTDFIKYLNIQTLSLILQNIDELRELRNQFIKKDFNGHNHQELAEKYQIDVRQVHRILKH